VLGVGATLGRTIMPDDDRIPGGDPVVMLSYNYWQRRFAGNPSILGKTLVINGHNMTLIGVAQPGFEGVELGHRAGIFVPVMMKAQMTPGWDALKDRRWRWVNAFGRLKPGVTRQQAKAALQPFFHNMLAMEVKEPAFAHAAPETVQGFLRSWIDVLPGSQGRSYFRQALITPLWLLLAVTGTVLLLACANLANLLLARAAARQREFAIRLAIGAGAARIVRQLLVESFLLAASGAAVGLLLAAWADQLLLKVFVADSSEIAITTTPDLRILAFTFGITLVTTILFGLVPAFQAARADVAPTLKDQGGAVVGGSNVLLRKSLVAAQVTLSVLLLIGAGLFIRTLSNLRGLGPGFATQHLIGFELDPSLSGYKGERSKLFYSQLTERLAALPGVSDVGIAGVRILEDDEWDSSMTVEGYSFKPGENPEPYMNLISPNYFATMGIPIVAGRDFTVKDNLLVPHGNSNDPDDTTPTTAIINQKFAKKYFGSRNPIGRHIGFGSDPGTKTDMEVIGMVKDVKYTNLRDEIPPQAFIPYLAVKDVGGMTVYVRTTRDPSQIMGAIRNEVRGLDSNIPIYSLRSADEQIDNSLRIERLIASLSSVFGLLATLLAVIGLYGVMAYAVSRRTREIGIRMALGAINSDVIWMVMREVLLLVAIGVAIGVPAAILLSQFVKSQLFGLEPHDPSTILASTVLLALVAGLAGLIPALRASRIDPMRALHYE
jgi:predicted permease